MPEWRRPVLLLVLLGNVALWYKLHISADSSGPWHPAAVHMPKVHGEQHGLIRPVISFVEPGTAIGAPANTQPQARPRGATPLTPSPSPASAPPTKPTVYPTPAPASPTPSPTPPAASIPAPWQTRAASSSSASGSSPVRVASDPEGSADPHGMIPLPVLSSQGVGLPTCSCTPRHSEHCRAHLLQLVQMKLHSSGVPQAVPMTRPHSPRPRHRPTRKSSGGATRTVSKARTEALRVSVRPPRSVLEYGSSMQDVQKLLLMLAVGIPYAFAHFNDGEVIAMRSSDGVTDRGMQRLSPALRALTRRSFSLNHQLFYRGVPCREVFPNASSWLVGHLRAARHPAATHQLRGAKPNKEVLTQNTPATVFIDGNYRVALPWVTRILLYRGATVHMVVSANADIDRFVQHTKLVPVSVLRVPSTNAFPLGYRKHKEAWRTFEPGDVVLLCAGPLGRILASEWFSKRDSVTYLELGSFYDQQLLPGGRTLGADYYSAVKFSSCMYPGDVRGRVNEELLQATVHDCWGQRGLHLTRTRYRTWKTKENGRKRRAREALRKRRRRAKERRKKRRSRRVRRKRKKMARHKHTQRRRETDLLVDQSAAVEPDDDDDEEEEEEEGEEDTGAPEQDVFVEEDNSAAATDDDADDDSATVGGSDDDDSDREIDDNDDVVGDLNGD